MSVAPSSRLQPEAYAAWLYQQWSDRELIASLLEHTEELDGTPDMDMEGHDEMHTITVDRMALRELMRRTRGIRDA